MRDGIVYNYILIMSEATCMWGIRSYKARVHLACTCICMRMHMRMRIYVMYTNINTGIAIEILYTSHAQAIIYITQRGIYQHRPFREFFTLTCVIHSCNARRACSHFDMSPPLAPQRSTYGMIWLRFDSEVVDFMPCINKLCGLLNRIMIKLDLTAPVAMCNTRGPATHAPIESNTSLMHCPLHEQ